LKDDPRQGRGAPRDAARAPARSAALRLEEGNDMSDAYTIRPAAPGDGPAVAALFMEMFDYHRHFDPVFSLSRSAEQTYGQWFVQQLDEPTALALVAEVGGKIVAFCMTVIRKRTRVHEDQYQTYGAIDDLSVTASQRGGGVGRALVDNSIQWLKLNGVRRVEIRVATSNAVSEAFWRSQDFRPYLTIMWREVS